MSEGFNQHGRDEIDPRFISGQWRGFWLQQDLRGNMHIYLTFRAGSVSGYGHDMVGSFAVSGAYDVQNGRTAFLKTYTQTHRIDYKGWAEVNQNGIWGVWTFASGTGHGGWHIWPDKPQGNPSQSIKRISRVVR